MTFRFLHAADLHLDTPFSGVSVTAPAVASELRDAGLAALDQLVRLAIERDVAFVVIAGHTYGGPSRGVRAQLELLRGVQELADRGIRTFIAPGGPEVGPRGWSAIREWPDLVTLFPVGTPTSVVVERDGHPIATVHGIGHRGLEITEDPAANVDLGDRPAPHIAVLHADGDQVVEHQPLSPAAVDRLVGSGIDYWALGHGRRQVLHREPWVVDPGSAQARSASDQHGAGGASDQHGAGGASDQHGAGGASDQHGAGGVYLVEVDDSGTIAEPELVAVDRVRFDRIEHAVDGIADLATLRDRLVDSGRRRLAEAEGRSVLLQVELVGRGPVHTELHRPGALVELVEGLRTESLSEPPLLWWDRVDVSTQPVHDLGELQGRNDFIADLVEETVALLADDDARARRTEEWDEELPSDLHHLLEGAAPSAVDPRRWRAAQDLAVDLVAGDEH